MKKLLLKIGRMILWALVGWIIDVGKAIGRGKKIEEITDDDFLFKPKERMIFKFWDGEKIREIDPMVLYGRLGDVSTELDVAIKLSRSASKDSRQGHREVVQLLSKIFGVKSFEEGGLTESELLDVFISFMEWVDRLKKNSPQSLTSVESTPSES